MSLAVFVAAASIWVFFCVLVAVVSAAAVDAPGRYRKAATVGLVVGIIFGVVSIYLVAYLGVSVRLVALLALVQLGRVAPLLVSVLFAILAGAIAGAAAGAVATRSAVGVRRCVVVGTAFGLVLGIANASVAPFLWNIVFPAIEAVGVRSPRLVVFGAATMAIGVMVDLALALVAFRIIRRRWGVPPDGSSRHNRAVSWPDRE